MAQGQSLNDVLKLYKIPDTKYCFPHDLNCRKLLNQNTFPPISAFTNKLKGGLVTISVQDYERSKAAFEKNCDSMKSYLAFYCFGDVKPLLEAAMAHSDLFYENFQIDIFSTSLTIPSIAHRIYMDSRKPLLPFWLPRTKAEDEQSKLECSVYDDVKAGIKGGFTCVMNRCQLSGITTVTMESPHRTKCIEGYDFNR